MHSFYSQLSQLSLLTFKANTEFEIALFCRSLPSRKNESYRSGHIIAPLTYLTIDSCNDPTHPHLTMFKVPGLAELFAQPLLEIVFPIEREKGVHPYLERFKLSMKRDGEQVIPPVIQYSLLFSCCTLKILFFLR